MEKNKTYEWLIPSFARHVNVNDAAEELERVENVYGSLTPEHIVDAAKNKKSVLHCLFEWNNSEAAKQYRLQQARNIINNIHVTIISDGEPISISYYEIIKTDEGRVYKSIDIMTFNEEEQVIEQTLKSLEQLKEKLVRFKKFHNIIVKLDEVKELLKNS